MTVKHEWSIEICMVLSPFRSPLLRSIGRWKGMGGGVNEAALRAIRASWGVWGMLPRNILKFRVCWCILEQFWHFWTKSAAE